MRPANKEPTMGELMGEGMEGKSHLGLSDLPKILGEKMPELPRNRIGKHRLINALQMRFGPGFRNIPMISGLIKEFDQEVETENIIRMNKMGRKNG
jgi:hypothetical protein